MKFLIVGRTGTGKDYLRNVLEEKYGWTFVKSYTTRPKRSDDEDTHIFITEEEAVSIPDKEKVAKTTISGYEYYATREQVENSDGYIIDPKGVKMLLDNMPDEDFCIVYINAESKEKQKMMSLSRSDDPKKEEKVFEERYNSENHQFFEFENYIFDVEGMAMYDNIRLIVTRTNDYKENIIYKLAEDLEEIRYIDIFRKKVLDAEKSNDTTTSLRYNDVIYLTAILTTMMLCMEAYDIHPEEELLYDEATRMNDKFVSEMKELGVGEATIGAIIAECGGCYWYKDDGSEEDEEIISLFIPDKIKERLERR